MSHSPSPFSTSLGSSGSTFRISRTFRDTRTRFWRLKQDETSQPHNMSNYNKLQKIYTKCDEVKKGRRDCSHNTRLLRNMLKRLQSRGQSFFRFGFRCDEKEDRSDILQQLLNLKGSQTSGTMSVSDLWTSKNMVRYLKSNQMFLNKRQLMIELKLLEKEEAKLARQALRMTTNVLPEKSEREKKCSSTPRTVTSHDLQETNGKFMRLIRDLSRLSCQSINMVNKQNSLKPIEEARRSIQKVGRAYNNEIIFLI